jgi:hypothetical protein
MPASGYEVPLPQVEVASQERPLNVDLVFSLCDGYCAHLAELQQQGPHLSAYCRTYVARALKEAFKKHLRAVTPATSWSTPPTDPAPPPPHICHALPPPPSRTADFCETCQEYVCFLPGVSLMFVARTC